MPPERLTPREAADRIRRRDVVAFGIAPAQPPAFLHALGERDDWEDLTVFAALLIDLFPLFARRGVRLLSGFHGPAERALEKAGHDVEFVPADFRRWGPLARRLSPRVVATAAGPGLRPGEVSLSLHAGGMVEELRRAGRDPDRLLVVELNSQLPSTHGIPPEHPHALALDDVDILIEVDQPAFTIPDAKPDDVERRIAAHALEWIPDGAMLQTGIGGVPSLVVQSLAEGERGGFGIHTEMFTTGLMHLCEAGKVDASRGGFGPFAVATFAAGTRELYDWLHRNDAVRFLPVEVTNSPAVIAGYDRMVSINGALSIDLAGQVAADTIGTRQFSGVGGHEDFTSGASMSEGGHSLVCLPSTATVGDETVSRIVARFAEGTTVTSPRHHVDVVITEWGAAELTGKTVRERIEALVAIAHPDFRDELRAEAPWRPRGGR